MDKANEIQITEYESGQRLDKYLQKRFNCAREGFLYKMLRKKRIKLNNSRAVGNEMLKPGDRLTFYLSPETMDQLMSARDVGAYPAVGSRQSDGNHPSALDIVFEDEYILAVNKPRGLLTHPQAEADDRRPAGTDTLIDRVLAYLHANAVFSAEKDSVFTPAFCNRLDRNTSGLVLCGKTPAALRELNRAIAGRGIDKYYLAVVQGETPPALELSAYHQKDAKTNRVSVSETGDKAMLTSFARLRTNGRYSLLSVKLVTGRSHQIRAQLSAIGHPVAGDFKYGAKTDGIKQQLLHAERVVFGGLNGVLAYLNGKELTAPPDEWFTRHAERLLR